MTNIWLLKLIHDADGKFKPDDIGSMEGLELLFELQNMELVEEDKKGKPKDRCWRVTDLGEYRLTLEDHSATELDKLATDAQKETVTRMAQFGWKPSHLWEYENDAIAVWMIAPNPTKPGSFTQGYVMPDGKLERYEHKVQVRGEPKEE